MRFLYGLLLGVIGTTVAGILYLAFAGGDYLLQLSPTYQELRTRADDLERAEVHREQLVARLDAMHSQFAELSRRFRSLHEKAETATPSAEQPSPENAGPEPVEGATGTEGVPSTSP